MKIKNLKLIPIKSGLKIVFLGTPDFVIPVLKTLDENFEVVGVITTPDTLQGRNKILTPPPVKVFAEQNNIPVFQFEKLEIGNWLALRESNVTFDITKTDVFVVAAYGLIIPKNILDIPRYGAINIHPSLLPKYRGASPIQTAILNGEKENGITIIKMDEEVDHGPILKKIPFEITDDDTFQSLHTKMFQIAAETLPNIINEYVLGNLKPIPQNHEDATFTKHITKQDGFIDISKVHSLSQFEIGNLKLEIARKIRAYFPWPTAWTRIRIKNDELRIMKFLPENKVQLEGGKPISVKEFLNGHADLKEVLEKLI